MYENVFNHQFNRYVRSKNRDPDTLTNLERNQMMSEMKEELYPGMLGAKFYHDVIYYSFICHNFIKFSYDCRIRPNPQIPY